MTGVLGRRIARAVASRSPVRAADEDARPIIVNADAFYSSAAGDLVRSLRGFVDFALHKAFYERDELAPNAIRASEVDRYLAEVTGHGHAGYAANGGLAEPTVRDCQDALDAIGHGAAALHRRFVACADPDFVEFDHAFDALEKAAPIVPALRDWLRALPELKVVPEAEYRASLNAYAARNQHAATRRKAREDAAREVDRRDPLKLAMTYLCMMAAEPRRFIAWRQSHPGEDLGDGVKVTRFLVETDRGPCSAFFHPQASVLFDNALKGDPIARVPTETVIAFVARRTGGDLMEMLSA